MSFIHRKDFHLTHRSPKDYVYGVDYFGFVYVWYNRAALEMEKIDHKNWHASRGPKKKHPRLYIGSHFGPYDDGYVCSSRWMKSAYKKYPQKFIRRILYWQKSPDRKELLKAEQFWLDKIHPDKLAKCQQAKFYNMKKLAAGGYFNLENTAERKKQIYTPERRKQISDRGKEIASRPGWRQKMSDVMKRPDIQAKTASIWKGKKMPQDYVERKTEKIRQTWWNKTLKKYPIVNDREYMIRIYEDNEYNLIKTSEILSIPHHELRTIFSRLKIKHVKRPKNQTSCARCGKVFFIKKSQFRRFHTHYCSRACKREAAKGPQVTKRNQKTSSKYVGVCFYKPSGKWMANITFNKKTRFLGYFSTEEDAYAARENKRIELSA